MGGCKGGDFEASGVLTGGFQYEDKGLCHHHEGKNILLYYHLAEEKLDASFFDGES